MASLYDIDNAILECIDMETGEVVDVEKLESLQLERDKKIENVALWYKNLCSDAEQYKAEKEHFAEREKAAKIKAESLKRYLDDALKGNKFSTARVNITYRKSKMIDIADLEAFTAWAEQYHDELLTYKPPTINKTAVRAYIESGEDAHGATIAEKTNIQIK